MNKLMMMGCLVVGALAFPTVVMAQGETGSGFLAVTGTVVSSISVTIETGTGGTFSGAGTSAATSALGSISKYSGTVPTGFTRTRAATTWTLASSIVVKVDHANSTSAAYTMRAQLASAPAGSVVWTVASVTLNNTALQTLAPAGIAYPTTETYSWSIQIPDALPTASAIDNTIEFSALAG